ncbi:hypothetical protein [Arthrobacter bambusae]|uniref:Uncharacterized protein n=1 Tax=Arthrobacter bambusae TaxID=1338426 RepID=A0AAW8D958_9MICC|nr:hypothetical protein [Arthrobacter bambusae]MDP9903169.1 hypothetical protein [Arthrobacter bambusae]MDQ0128837.1 hypothetical protein [Arthrobacter bambusae]MDQ0180178.1 hypothetical protein [Arthrobacter bambusae]
MANATSVTAKTALFTFYDIESLENVFTIASFAPHTNTVELFYLLEPGSRVEQDVNSHAATGQLGPVIAQAVFDANPAFKPTRPGMTDRRINIHDLSTAQGMDYLATMIGLFEGTDVNDPDCTDVHGGRFRPVCDTDPSYDPANHHPYLAGFNSYNYDTTMLAVLFHESYAATRELPYRFVPTTPKILRQHNDQLFSDQHREFMPGYLTSGLASMEQGISQGWNSNTAIIRKAMLDSGRHIDVARLNESQRMVALKRLLGGMGRQILESDKLGGHNARVETLQDFLELLAYNVSDVVGLHKLFEHSAYSGNFDLKKGLLDEYPEVIYKSIKGTHRPDISPKSVRMGRLTPDSTSAKFVARILAPYKDLEDIPAVSFLYPSQKIADETGRERRNVLDDCIEFFRNSIDSTTEQGRIAHEQFMTAMSYYRDMEGRNFNSDVSGPGTRPAGLMLTQVPRTANNLPYFNADGSPSSCFVTFSTGGIHGAEYDVQAYHAASAEHHRQQEMLDRAKIVFPAASELVKAAREQHNTIMLPDGTRVDKRLVLLGSDPEKVRWRKPKTDNPVQVEHLGRAQRAFTEASSLLARQRPAEQELWVTLDDGYVIEGKVLLQNSTLSSAAYREHPVQKLPQLFEKLSRGDTKLKPQFKRTSADLVTHEDFTSYYPNMLRNMSAFFNEHLGEDRYAKIFEDKERYGRETKALKKQLAALPDGSPEAPVLEAEISRLDVLRNGTKLILNSASGAGDTNHKNPIRMNNQIISMRIIGQLFSWRIGQAQTIAGARIVSTNTDGLYSVLDPEINNRVLAEQAKLINVEIEPEQLYLVSKDSNNRLEIHVPSAGMPLHEAEFISGSGGTLACFQEPQPTKSLAHPAVLDWALARYLREIIGGRTINERPLALDEPLNRDVGRWLMAQARDELDPLLAARLFQNVLAASAGKITFPFATDPQTGEASALQHYNRVFVMKAGTARTVSIQAAGAWVVNEASRLKRQTDGMNPTVTDRTAHRILISNGMSRDGQDQTQPVPHDQDISVRKVPRIDPEWAMRIDNRDLVELDPDTIRSEILDHLDLDVYVEMLAATFEENWMNVPHTGSREPEQLVTEQLPDQELAA